MDTSFVFSKKYQVDFSGADFKKNLKPSSLFEYFQDIASIAAQKLGVGIAVLEEEYGVIWVLTRMRVDIYRNPSWNENITIETWHQEHGRLSFERDFYVKDENGEIIAAAVSTWMLLDIITREVRKAAVLGLKEAESKPERAIDCRLGNLKPFTQLEEVYKKFIGYSDIDINGHINNSKYVGYAMDCLDTSFLELKEIKSIEINYINEAMPGDTLVICRSVSPENPDLIYIEGLSAQSGKTVFKTQLTF